MSSFVLMSKSEVEWQGEVRSGTVCGTSGKCCLSGPAKYCRTNCFSLKISLMHEEVCVPASRQEVSEISTTEQLSSDFVDLLFKFLRDNFTICVFLFAFSCVQCANGVHMSRSFRVP